jgi:hypothetical protein
MPEITVIYATTPVGKGLKAGISLVELTNYVQEVPFFVNHEFRFENTR